MKKAINMFVVAVLGGAVALGAGELLKEESSPTIVERTVETPSNFTNYPGSIEISSMDFTLAAEKTVNAVVHVRTESEVDTPYNPWMELFGYEEGEAQVQHGSGSGVIISNDGYIVTNNHVIEGATKISISLNNNKSYNGRIIGTDPSTDIALIKIDEENLPSVTFGDSDKLRIGEWVVAVGNPFDLTSTVTAGIVSAKARNINLLRGDANRDIFPIESFIQTDAAVNPGNSGGALVNTAGELVGINTAIASRTGSYSGYSFAVPSSMVEKITRDLMEYGNVQRAFIGIRIGDVSELMAEELGLDEVSGVYVNELTENGAAHAAGIQAGDVILKVGGKDVSNVAELQERVSRYRPGDTLSVEVWRDAQIKRVSVVLRNKDGLATIDKKPVRNFVNFLGADLSNLGDSERKQLGIEGGAKVIGLHEGKLSRSGVKRNFIITEVNGQKISDSKELVDALDGEKGGVLIEGLYPNGQKAYYGFGMQ